jgi:antitoxin component of MazEF toxin-antitoxin module
MRIAELTTAQMVPPAVLAALHLSAHDTVLWEVRNGEAVMRAGAMRPSVDAVAGMLAPALKGKRIAWKAAAASAREAWGRVR